MPDPKLIHIGLHKTGTSWLQEALGRRNSEGLTFCPPSDLVRRAFILPAIPDFDPDRAREMLQPILDTGTDLPLMISDEALGGRPFHSGLVRETVIARIRAVFPDTQIMITIREQSAVIHSLYGQYVRFGFSSSLAQFLAQPAPESSYRPVLDRGYYEYDRLVAYLLTQMPEDHLWIVPMEWMLQDSAAFLAELGTRLGTEIAPHAASADRIVNPAWSPPALWAARQANRLHAQDSRWLRTRRGLLHPNSLAARIDRLIPAARKKAQHKAARAFVKDTLGDHYAASNSRLARHIGLDLGALGYSVS